MLKFKNNRGDGFVKQEFKTLSAFNKYLADNVDTPSKYHSATKDRDWEFSQTSNIEEAYNIAKNGSPEIMRGLKEAVKLEVEKLRDELMAKRKHDVGDVEGIIFDVAKVLNGEPEAWLRRPIKKNAKPKIRLTIMGNYGGGMDSYEMIQNASKIIALIKTLEEHQIDVHVDMLFAAEHIFKDKAANKEMGLYTSITMKGFGETFNWAKISGMLHPSFFRRLIFRTREIVGGKNMYSGYGHTIDPSYTFEDISRLIEVRDTESINRFKKSILKEV